MQQRIHCNHAFEISGRVVQINGFTFFYSKEILIVVDTILFILAPFVNGILMTKSNTVIFNKAVNKNHEV